MRTTVVIPLFRSERWFDVVRGNVERLAPVARVVVSDPSGVDPVFVELSARSHPDSVEFFGARTLAPGWVAHANELARRASTPYVMWLPHDDDLEPAWITASEALLDADPSMIAAVGRVTAPEQRAPFPHTTEYSASDRLVRVAAGLRDLASNEADRLGLLFRAVQRREAAPELPSTPGDAWADVPWALRLLSRGRIGFHEAVTVKRWTDESASAQWEPPAGRTEWLRWALAEFDDAEQLTLAMDAWDAEMRHKRALEERLTTAWREASLAHDNALAARDEAVAAHDNAIAALAAARTAPTRRGLRPRRRDG